MHNFKISKGDVIFRSAQDGEISTLSPEDAISFEVDHIDDAMSEGRSALATGPLHRVQLPGPLLEAESLGITPWAGGERHAYYRLFVTGLTGKRISALV